MIDGNDSELDKASKARAQEASPVYMNFPEPSAPLTPSHRIGSIRWAGYMDEIEPMLQRCLRDRDRPEDRLARKIPERFVLFD